MIGARIRIFLFFSVFALFCNLEGAGVCAPMPPEIAINHETGQCAQVMRGDECTNCYLPEGWEVLGLDPDVSCPAGYEMIDLVLDCVEDYDCRRIPEQDDGSWHTPNLTLMSIPLGLCLCGLVVLLIGIVLAIWLIRRTRKSERNL